MKAYKYDEWMKCFIQLKCNIVSLSEFVENSYNTRMQYISEFDLFSNTVQWQGKVSGPRKLS